MKEERMAILKMVEDGKISPNDAVKLMYALNNERPKRDFCLEEKFNKASQAMDEFAKDVKEKVNTVAKEVEPKFKKTTHTIIEKTSQIVDELAQTLREAVNNVDDYTDETNENCDECKNDIDIEVSNDDNDKDDTPREN